MAEVPDIKITIEDCWISCADKMPEPFVSVLVAGGVGLWTGTQWNTITGCAWPGQPIAWNVTHWMFIPKIPKRTHPQNDKTII